MYLQILRSTKFKQIHIHVGVYAKVALILPLTKCNILLGVS